MRRRSKVPWERLTPEECSEVELHERQLRWLKARMKHHHKALLKLQGLAFERLRERQEKAA